MTEPKPVLLVAHTTMGIATVPAIHHQFFLQKKPTTRAGGTTPFTSVS